MPLPFVQRRRASADPRRSPALRIESRPPSLWPDRFDWRSRFGDWLRSSSFAAAGDGFGFPRRRRLGEALVTARLDFADALIDVRIHVAAGTLDRIAVARSLHELWHLREEVFSVLSLRHDQAEAGRRLNELDRHFPKRRLPAPR